MTCRFPRLRPLLPPVLAAAFLCACGSGGTPPADDQAVPDVPAPADAASGDAPDGTAGDPGRFDPGPAASDPGTAHDPGPGIAKDPGSVPDPGKTCLPRATVACHDGDVWWVDSCGALDEVQVQCDDGCADGKCTDCVPDCDGRQCGPNGCGGVCGVCNVDQVCGSDGVCACAPGCGARECGFDACGHLPTLCGTCAPWEECQEGRCIVTCTDQCPADAECGADGCGRPCGQCAADRQCDANRCVPVCTPTCAGDCGPNGCGGYCGKCAVDEYCASGTCRAVVQVVETCSELLDCPKDLACVPPWTVSGVPTACVKKCLDRGDAEARALATTLLQCITNRGCDPASPTFQTCVQSGCTAALAACMADNCLAQCAGKECGRDGCGGSCGTCGPAADCLEGKCTTVCLPNCSGRECGGDGCDGSCGKCAQNETCNGGQCVPWCVGNCAGRECGSDFCVGNCGTCGDGKACDNGRCVTDPALCGGCGDHQYCEAADSLCHCKDGYVPNPALTGCLPLGDRSCHGVSSGYCVGDFWIYCDGTRGLQYMDCLGQGFPGCISFSADYGACACGLIDDNGTCSADRTNHFFCVSGTLLAVDNCAAETGQPGGFCAHYVTSFGSQTACFCQQCSYYLEDQGCAPACTGGSQCSYDPTLNTHQCD